MRRYFYKENNKFSTEVLSKHFGGKGITLEKLLKILPKYGVDGTNYSTRTWLADVATINTLLPGKSPVYIPYGGAQVFGVLKEVIWDKYEFKVHIDNTDVWWWIHEPHMLVDVVIDGEERCYNVYEYTFYKNLKRKTQWKHIDNVGKRGKQKFYSRKEMSALKKQHDIVNSINKRNGTNK